jgi:penicillin amidase
MYNLFVPPNARDVITRTALTRTIDWLLAPDGHFGKDPLAGRDALVLRSMEEAVAELTRRLGADMRHWQYGQEKYKHALLRHPMSAAVTSAMRARLEAGPVPRGGYAHTVNNTGGSDNLTSGASFRIIAVTEDWDKSVGTNTPGQSGNPDNPHYRDLFPLWATGKYFPVFYTREKVESVANSKLVLMPTR